MRENCLITSSTNIKSRNCFPSEQLKLLSLIQLVITIGISLLTSCLRPYAWYKRKIVIGKLYFI